MVDPEAQSPCNYAPDFTVWYNQMGTVWKLTLFEKLQLIINKLYWSHLNSENSSSSVFVSSKSYYLFSTCLNVWYIICRLMKNVCFRTVPIWLHHTVCTITAMSVVSTNSVLHCANMVFQGRRQHQHVLPPPPIVFQTSATKNSLRVKSGSEHTAHKNMSQDIGHYTDF